MKWLDKSKIWAMVLLALPLLLALYLHGTDASTPTAASKVLFARAQVVDVVEEDMAPDAWTEGRRIGVQLLTFEIAGGRYDGQEISAVHPVSAYTNIDTKEGTWVVLRLDTDETGMLYVVAVESYHRLPVLLGLLVVFAGLLVFLGGRKGVSALLGLAYTGFALWGIFIPLVQRGVSPILSAVLLVAVATTGTLVLLNGASAKTGCAILGCVGGVATAGICAYVVGILTPINGFNMPEAEELVLRATQQGLSVSGLLVAGILIAALGAVMDVSMTITSAIFEVRQANPKLPQGALMRSGMNIGKDAMGTMANTLILAFAGASLNTLILFQVFDYPSLQLLNSDLIAIEMIQGLAGSIGIVLTVPLVSWLGSYMALKITPKA